MNNDLHSEYLDAVWRRTMSKNWKNITESLIESWLLSVVAHIQSEALEKKRTWERVNLFEIIVFIKTTIYFQFRRVLALIKSNTEPALKHFGMIWSWSFEKGSCWDCYIRTYNAWPNSMKYQFSLLVSSKLMI